MAEVSARSPAREGAIMTISIFVVASRERRPARAPPAARSPLPVVAVPRAAATDESRALQLLSGVIERVGQDRGPTRRAKYKSREPSFFGARPRASKLLSFSLPIAACCAFVIATFMMKWPIAARVVVRHVENN